MFSLGNSLRRHFVSLSLASVATAALFFLMQHLIHSDRPAYEEVSKPRMLGFDPRIPKIVTPPPPTPPAPPPPVVPPPIVVLPTIVDGPGAATAVRFQPPTSEKIVPQIHGRADGGLMSLALVAPQYPERAKRNGIEGYVVVEFTVDARGAVRDPLVVEAHPQGTFERQALTAILRSKFRPKVEGGIAQVVRGVRKRLTFELQN